MMPSLPALHFSSPAELPRLFAEAWNSRNPAGIAGLFAEEAEFVNVVGLWWHSRQDIYDAHEYGLRTIFSNSVLKVGRIKETPLGDGVILIHARMKLFGQSEHGDTISPGQRQNIFSFVVVREKYGWICKSAHNTDVVPGKETNIIDDDGKLKAVDYR